MNNWGALGVPKASAGETGAPKAKEEVDVSKLEPPSLVPKKQEGEAKPKPADKPKLPGLL